MTAEDLHTLTSIRDLFHWAEELWPNFFDWAVNDHNITEEEIASLAKALENDAQFFTFMEHLKHVSTAFPRSPEDNQVLLFGGNLSHLLH